jgi:hypothetical protein
MKFKSVKMTKQQFFIIENNLQKVGRSFFLLVPPHNRGPRSICPTSVFTGTGQTDKR